VGSPSLVTVRVADCGNRSFTLCAYPVSYPNDPDIMPSSGILGQTWTVCRASETACRPIGECEPDGFAVLQHTRTINSGHAHLDDDTHKDPTSHAILSYRPHRAAITVNPSRLIAGCSKTKMDLCISTAKVEMNDAAGVPVTIGDDPNGARIACTGEYRSLPGWFHSSSGGGKHNVPETCPEEISDCVTDANVTIGSPGAIPRGHIDRLPSRGTGGASVGR